MAPFQLDGPLLEQDASVEPLAMESREQVALRASPGALSLVSLEPVAVERV